MKAYKLIKSYPGSPVIGTVICSDDSYYINEYWKDITWDIDLENSIGRYVSLKKHNSYDKRIYVLVDDILITDVLIIISKNVEYSVKDYSIRLEDNLAPILRKLPKIGDFYVRKVVNKETVIKELVIPLEVTRKDDGNFTIGFCTYDLSDLKLSGNIDDYLSVDNKFRKITYTQVTFCDLDTFYSYYKLTQENNIQNILNSEYNEYD